jgi:DNA repair exonuclease SbcCD ATPase subunit
MGPDQVRRVDAERQLVARQLAVAEMELAAAQADVTAAEEARAIAQQVAAELQRKAHSQICNVVSKALSTVFPDPYRFELRFEEKRGKTEARPVFIRNGQELGRRIGGGVYDVAAFALRIAAVLLQRPAARRVLFLDEPFRFVSERNLTRDRVRDLVTTLARELDFQFILVTHDRVLEIGKVVELRPASAEPS